MLGSITSTSASLTSQPSASMSWKQRGAALKTTQTTPITVSSGFLRKTPAHLLTQPDIWKAGYPFSQPTWELRNEPEYRVHRTWLAVQFRLVTVPQDEALIIASVLGLDVTKIQAIEVRQLDGTRQSDQQVAARRMVKLLDLIDQTPSLGVPSGIIFLPPSPFPEDVAEAKGYSWAPSTWLMKQVRLPSRIW